MTQAVAKLMVNQGVKDGSIVNLASIVGKVSQLSQNCMHFIAKLNMSLRTVYATIKDFLYKRLGILDKLTMPPRKLGLWALQSPVQRSWQGMCSFAP